RAPRSWARITEVARVGRPREARSVRTTPAGPRVMRDRGRSTRGAGRMTRVVRDRGRTTPGPGRTPRVARDRGRTTPGPGRATRAVQGRARASTATTDEPILNPLLATRCSGGN